MLPIVTNGLAQINRRARRHQRDEPEATERRALEPRVKCLPRQSDGPRDLLERFAAGPSAAGEGQDLPVQRGRIVHGTAGSRPAEASDGVTQTGCGRGHGSTSFQGNIFSNAHQQDQMGAARGRERAIRPRPIAGAHAQNRSSCVSSPTTRSNDRPSSSSTGSAIGRTCFWT